MSIITLARQRALPHNDPRSKGARNMARCSEIQTGVHRSRSFRPIWLAVSQGAAAILMGIAAFLVSLQPAWSNLARPGDARSGALLLKSEAGYTEAVRLGIDVDLTVSGPT